MPPAVGSVALGALSYVMPLVKTVLPGLARRGRELVTALRWGLPATGESVAGVVVPVGLVVGDVVC